MVHDGSMRLLILSGPAAESDAEKLARQVRALGYTPLRAHAPGATHADVLLALNNLFVVLDILVLPDVDLVPARKLTTLAAAAVMVAGFVWETE